MKSLFLFLSVMICSTFLYGQDSLKQSITTYGTVELNVPADFATVSFAITSEGSSLREAVEKAKKRIENIVFDLKTLGVKESNISTTHFYSGENVGGKSFLSSKSDFKAEITTFIKVDSLNMVEEIVLSISDHKPDEINNITFALSNPEEYRMKAIDMAVKKAKEKAEILAKNLNVSLDEPLDIEELNMVLLKKSC